ncbi:MAG: hypothetical protein AKCLJLPJ_00495 [Fimbriimonadales bacterium]|nr:MAG: hypothetical protein EDM73_03430 [Armatimonadota bacterium]MBV6502449.1 hypothetical protein [Fimbriimonadales bacterium]MCE7898710.1 hypothetical protein [Armatimonadetes bacterium ATM1]MDL1927998.1 hypothetical protein [Fimbriimonadia bacterium ATM]MBC6968452.1 hypothetical protein [Armatimonadota bacterium]
MKLLTIALSAVIVIGALFIGLGYIGIVNIPGITPPKPKKVEDLSPIAEDGDGGVERSIRLIASALPPPPPEEESPTAAQPAEDGTDRLAKLWSSMDAESVLRIVEKWDAGDALAVLVKMDDKKLAELLQAMSEKNPDQAARISQGIKSLEQGGI